MTTISDMSSGTGVNRNTLRLAACLVGVGGLMFAAGAALTAVVTVGAIRRWTEQLEETPSQMARRRLSQARAATSAGIEAWRNEKPTMAGPAAG
jgi:hypothetical protein